MQKEIPLQQPTNVVSFPSRMQEHPSGVVNSGNPVFEATSSSSSTLLRPFEAITTSVPPGQESSMDDKDVRRLEERIDASSRESGFRIDTVMAKIDGNIARIGDHVDNLRNEFSSQRTELSLQRVESRSQFLWTVGLIIGAWITLFVGLGGLFIGVKQVWGSGVQSGQQMQIPPK